VPISAVPETISRLAQLNKKLHLAPRAAAQARTKTRPRYRLGLGVLPLSRPRMRCRRFTGLTSRSQHKLATERAAAAGPYNPTGPLSPRDYREEQGHLHASSRRPFSSMSGSCSSKTFLQQGARVLEEGRRPLVHAIRRARPRGVTNPWNPQIHLSPGGYFPGPLRVLPAVEKSLLLVTEPIRDMRLHYANLARLAPSFQAIATNPQASTDDRFCRM